MKNNLDVLLVARPDHSLSIYQALLKSNYLDFKFITFKVFPRFVKRILHSKKMVSLSKNVIVSYKLSIINICKYTLNLRIAQNWNENDILNSLAGKLLKHNDAKIIHYWPEYGNSEILRYKKSHPDAVTLADIHMPYPMVVFQQMIPIYERNGIDPQTTNLYILTQQHKDLLNGENSILVPSEFVADTYRSVFSDLKIHTVSYGITPSSYYSKKQGPVKQFVYAGRVSLEKGGDLLLEYFANHPEFRLHIYGSIDKDQSAIFKRYEDLQNIVFHGQVPKVELQKEMSKYDVGIHLSRFDAYSLAVGEMIGVGLPVIVSCNTGNKDDVVKYNFGCVTDLNLDSVSWAIQTMVNNYSVYTDSISDYLLNKYTSYGDSMVNFYKKILNT